MATPAKARASYEDVLNAPEHQVAEIVGGDLYLSPRPAPLHSVAATHLAGDLVGPFQDGRGGPGGWWILLEPELHLQDEILVPDLGGWRRDRLPSIPDDAYFTLAPDWICEVLSPSTTRLDRIKKLPVYAREGVRYAWLVDPRERTLEGYRLENGRSVLLATHGADEVVRAEPFEAVGIDLLLLWGESRTDPQPG